MKNYTSKHFDIQVNDGMIIWKLKSDEEFYPHHSRKFRIHFDLGCEVANKLAESATDEWYKLCLCVMDTVFEYSKIIKNDVISKMSYGHYFPKQLEEINLQKTGFSFEEAKAYIKGYSDAVCAFKDNFNVVDEQFRHCLDEVFPN